jgi:uncharacterized protein YdaU (DUF1376 family)
MHYYKRNIGDYAKKAGRLTMLQHGAYTLLIDSCYDREMFPTLEQALEWTWASTEHEVEAVKFVLNRFFVLEESGCYVQNRIQDDLSNYHKNSDINKRIAIDRETKRRENRTNREQHVDEAPPNQEPLTINQEPRTNDIHVKNGKPFVYLKRVSCPVEELLNVYHEECKSLPKVIMLNDTRRKHLVSRWRDVDAEDNLSSKEEGIEIFRDIFRQVQKSDFLCGRTQNRNGRVWKASFDWIMLPTNFLKVVEGQYDNGRG